MAAKKKEELKKNELADIIEAKLEALKPYSSAIGIVVLVLVLVIGGLIWMVVRNQQKNEQAWADFYQASYQAQLEESDKLLEDNAVRLADTPAGLWSRQYAADFRMSEGSREVFRNRDAGLKEISRAKEDYQYVVDSVDKSKHQLLWSRASFGLARALESLGEFEEAKKTYELIAAELKDSVLGKAAAENMARVASPTNVAWYKAFKTREQDDLLSMLGTPGDAPDSDTGLPPRPDFSYPEIIVPGPGGPNDEPPPPPDGSNEEPPPAPPENDAKSGSPKSGEPADNDSKKDDAKDDAAKDDANGDETKADGDAKSESKSDESTDKQN